MVETAPRYEGEHAAEIKSLILDLPPEQALQAVRGFLRVYEGGMYPQKVDANFYALPRILERLSKASESFASADAAFGNTAESINSGTSAAVGEQGANFDGQFRERQAKLDQKNALVSEVMERLGAIDFLSMPLVQQEALLRELQRVSK